MIFWEFARRNIRIHLLRSALATLGIIIGVIAIGSMGILGNTMIASLSESLKSVGDSVTVTPYSGEVGSGTPGDMSDGKMPGQAGDASVAGNQMISDLNFQQIKRTVAPDIAIPVYQTSEHVKVGVGSQDDVIVIYGLPPDKTRELGLKFKSGDYNTGNYGCIVGSTYARDHNIRVGSRLTIGPDGNKGTLRVSGILEERGISFDIGTDDAVIATDTWFENTYNRDKNYDEVVVKVRDGNTAGVKKSIEKQLNRNINKKIVSVMDSKATLESLFETFGSLTVFVSAIGGISMIVAGVSIFNIMMMSVNERVKEIGIMRSLGVQKNDVMTMFLYEAFIIGMIGSSIGSILSILTGYGMSTMMIGSSKFFFSIPNVVTIFEGFFFGVILCIFCGLYPSWRASNMNPMHALRHE